MEAGANNMASDINKFTQRIAQSFPKQQKFTFELEDLLKDTACHKQLRISQIDLIDILSPPTPEEGEIMKLISENNLEVKSDLPLVTAEHMASVICSGIIFLEWGTTLLTFQEFQRDPFLLPSTKVKLARGLQTDMVRLLHLKRS